MNDEETEIVYSYTRKQAVADGEQIDVSEVAREAGLRFRCFVTRAVWCRYVEVPNGVKGQEEGGRLFDVLHMLRCAIKGMVPAAHRDPGGVEIHFWVYVRNDNRRARKVTLKAVIGPVDIDDPAPAITILLPEED